jgi:hypothetical protein
LPLRLSRAFNPTCSFLEQIAFWISPRSTYYIDRRIARNLEKDLLGWEEHFVNRLDIA